MKSGHHGHHGHQGHHGHHGHQGHQGHVVVVKKHGGKVKEDERTKEMVHEEEEGHKHGGKVKGEHGRHHLGRKARGGRMTPKSPFTGADVKKAPYESTLHGIDEGGKGSHIPHP